MIAPNDKAVMIIDENLPLGLIANTAAILGVTLGQSRPQVVGPNVNDADGHTHLGITTTPVPILKSSPESLKELRARLYGPDYQDLLVIDFSDVAQGCQTYDEYANKAALTRESDHNYLGLAIYGPKKTVNKLTGNLPLLR